MVDNYMPTSAKGGLTRKERREMMNALSNSQIDEAILSVTGTSWRKVAPVIVMTGEILGDNLPKDEAGPDLIADRIGALIHDGRLLAQGDIKKWRRSEVRKPASN